MVPLTPMMTITRSNPRKVLRTGRSISAVSSSVRPNFRSPIYARCRRARKSLATTAWKAGAVSENGKVCLSGK